MKNITQRVWIVTGAVALLLIGFGLGYVTGNNGHKGMVETTDTLSPTDMEHAFGTATPATPVAHESMTQETMASSLNDLVAGLEKKVADNPENIDQQLLLAKTYKELGSREKGIKLLKILNNRAPKNAEVKVTLATILMAGSNKQDLNEAAQLFVDASKLNSDVATMAHENQDEIRAKLEKLSK